MNQLQVINQDGRLLVDSREVAEMVERQHNELMKSIRNYTEHLTKGDFTLSDFFIPSNYSDSTGRTLPCFLITKKGCDMVANKMTGEKGVLFTATYVTKFEEMEKGQALNVSGLSPQLQLLINMEQGLKQIEQRQLDQEQQLTTIKETFLQRDENWRSKMNGLLNGAANRMGGHQVVKRESYRLLEERAKCNLSKRLTNLHERLADSGATKTKIKDTNRLDVIESEPRLKEIYTTIVKELAIGTLI